MYSILANLIGINSLSIRYFKYVKSAVSNKVGDLYSCAAKSFLKERWIKMSFGIRRIDCNVINKTGALGHGDQDKWKCVRVWWSRRVGRIGVDASNADL